MNKRDIKLLKRLYTFDENRLHEYLVKRLESLGYLVYDSNGYYVYAIHPEIDPIMLVAHLDTVHTKPPKFKDLRINGELLDSRIGGTGADDRNGVFAILKILQKGYRPSVLFTHGEEVGGLGASEFVTDFFAPDIDYKFVIEIDRRNIAEVVYYDCGNKDFKDLINSYGFRESWGTFSDISTILPVWDIAGCNVSAGYLDEHTSYETTVLSGLQYTIDRLIVILKSLSKLGYYDFQDESVWSDTISYGYRYGKSTRKNTRRNIHKNTGFRNTFTDYIDDEEKDDIIDIYKGGLRLNDWVEITDHVWPDYNGRSGIVKTISSFSVTVLLDVPMVISDMYTKKEVTCYYNEVTKIEQPLEVK